jgi:hypothetical protein
VVSELPHLDKVKLLRADLRAAWSVGGSVIKEEEWGTSEATAAGYPASMKASLSTRDV